MSGQGAVPDSLLSVNGGHAAGKIEERTVKITLKGQVRGGKNSMGVTKTGIHYPLPAFRAWRDAMLAQVQAQFSGPTICEPCLAHIVYWAGDRKRRDVPAILDAIWHVLERAGVVFDDSLIKSVYLTGGYDKENPRAEIELTAQAREAEKKSENQLDTPQGSEV
jgi:Holliday junction resolvase RusA-like endonuclease